MVERIKNNKKQMDGWKGNKKFKKLMDGWMAKKM